MTVLDLDAVAPPGQPKIRENTPMSFRASPALAAHVRESAARENMAPAAWLERLVRQDRDGGPWLPPDVLAWLTVQAAQCGCPGATEQALVLILRHLADRWPHGARLREP